MHCASLFRHLSLVYSFLLCWEGFRDWQESCSLLVGFLKVVLICSKRYFLSLISYICEMFWYCCNLVVWFLFLGLDRILESCGDAVSGWSRSGKLAFCFGDPRTICDKRKVLLVLIFLREILSFFCTYHYLTLGYWHIFVISLVILQRVGLATKACTKLTSHSSHNYHKSSCDVMIKRLDDMMNFMYE